MYNEEPKPFVWTKSADEILESVARFCQRTSDSVYWIAQGLLRAVQYTALPKKTRRHGIRPIIRFVMQTTAHLTRSARRWCARFAKTNFRLDWLYQAIVTLEAMTPSRSRAPPRKAAA